MQSKLTFLLLVILSGSAVAQLTIDAGNDTIICVGVWGVDTTEIGGDPTASGGVEPYVYSWSTKYVIGTSTFGAAYFLDDPTLPNPKIVNDFYISLKLTLLVTDSAGAQASDSINIRFSEFAYLDFDCIKYITAGDTVKLHGTMGRGIEPLSFFWSPNYNISDTSVASPHTWPDTSMQYYVYAIDSIGCISGQSSCRIFIDPLSTESVNEIMVHSLVYPNPLNGNSLIYFDPGFRKDLKLEVFNSQGQLFHTEDYLTNSYEIGKIVNKKGLYFYVIRNEQNIYSSGKFLVP